MAIAVVTSRDSLGQAKVGDCLTSRESGSAKVVACSDSSAAYEVVNVVQMSRSDVNTIGQQVCGEAATSILWVGKGDSGRTYCLRGA